jgi:uncharacterized protein (TIGR03643 family)
MQLESDYCYYSDLPSPAAYAEDAPVVAPVSETPSAVDISRIIEMAWEDRTPFEAIRAQFGLTEAEVKALMKKQLKFSSYIRWRRRVEHAPTKHLLKRSSDIDRFRSAAQRAITFNQISKRKQS